MAELVVGAIGDDGTESDPEGEEGLYYGLVPGLHLEQLAPVRHDVEEDAVQATGQGHAADQEGEQDHVGEKRCRRPG